MRTIKGILGALFLGFLVLPLSGCLTGAALGNAGVIGDTLSSNKNSKNMDSNLNPIDTSSSKEHWTTAKPLYLLLLPVTVPLDVVMSPFELVFFLCWHDC
jgi:hypothetical protein